MIDQPELIYPTEIVGGCISIYRNVWSEQKINDVIETMNQYSENPNTQYKFSPASVIHGVQGSRTNYNMSLNNAADDDEKMKKINEEYFDLVFSRSVGYNKHFDIAQPVFFNEGFNILKYQTGQEYKAHYDSGSAMGRTISPILYLNDDYEGGEIEFVNFNIKIKPEKGMLVIFPSTYPYTHIAHPVILGTKYAIVTWLHDRPWDDVTSRAFMGNINE